MIDLLPGVAAINDSDVATLTFDSFESQLNDLLAAGVRIFGPNASVAADLEPEYVCVSDDDLTALVTLQENNAIAVVDLVTLQITEIRALGGKDHSLTSNLLDASDKGGEIFFASWPIKGLYMPDAIECFEVGGVVYGISANEGDAREYDNLVEAQRLKDVDLDPTVFPDARFLQKEELLGRQNITTASGDTDGDGDYDEIYSFGGRSITIWDMTSGTPVWDSGSDFEVITANDPEWGGIFNASNGTSAVFKTGATTRARTRVGHRGGDRRPSICLLRARKDWRDHGLRGEQSGPARIYSIHQHPGPGRPRSGRLDLHP
ncbi:MAG: hypothetical protein IPG32_16735 [Saprospirales bacterium]|nr:hypothetical protein [Saprospirales bacterium]